MKVRIVKFHSMSKMVTIRCYLERETKIITTYCLIQRLKEVQKLELWNFKTGSVPSKSKVGNSRYF